MGAGRKRSDMRFFEKNGKQLVWFFSGFVVGLTLLSIGHASLPKKSLQINQPAKPQTTVSEIQGGKVGSPDLESEFSNLNALEGKYAESYEQQQRLKSLTARVARSVAPAQNLKKKKAKQ